MKKISLFLLPVLLGVCGSYHASKVTSIKETPSMLVENIKVKKASESTQGHEETNAFDKNYDSYWEAKEDNAVLEIDLKEPKYLKNVTQVFGEEDIWYFRILGSLDGANYFELLDNSFGLFAKTFSESVSGLARYVKLEIEKSEMGLNPSSTEFYVEVEDLADGYNVAKGYKGKASGNAGGYDSSKAFDGDLGSYWCAPNGSYPQYVSNDFPKPVFANRIELYMQDYGSYGYNLSVTKSDGTVVDIVKSYTSIGYCFKFDLGYEIKGVKFELTGGPGWGNLAELKVIGFENIATGSETVSYNNLHFVNKIISSNTNIEGSLDNVNFEKIQDLNNINKQYRYLRGLSANDVIYGRDLYQILNLGMKAKVSDFIDEKHCLEMATMDPKNSDNSSTYFQSETAGGDHWILFDLQRICEISKLRQVFGEATKHSFEVFASENGKDFEQVWDVTSNTYVIDNYEIKLDEPILARYVKVVFHCEKDQFATCKNFYIYGNGSSKVENWWQDQSGVIRFYPKKQVNTFREITSRLDEFRYSGYRVIELHQPYEGLADIWAGLGATDSFKTDPIIGEEAELRNLLELAHNKGIKIFMFGNVGYGKYNSDYFKKACRDYALGINSRERNWFRFSNTCPDPTKWFWNDLANAYVYGYWGENGKIPTYNFENEEWQVECKKYITYWANFGFDGIALDAPSVYYFGSAGPSEVTFKSITNILRKNNMFACPEGNGDVNYIYSYKYNCVQNYEMSSWGGGARSAGLDAAIGHTANGLENKAKATRDNAVSLGGVSLTTMNFEDYYDEATGEQRYLESALVTTTGYLAFVHSGTDSKIGQDMLKEYDDNTQLMIARNYALQNALSGLNASGLRTGTTTNNDNRYYAFVRTNLNGNARALCVFNYHTSQANIEINLKNVPFDVTGKMLIDAYTNKVVPFTVSGDKITITVKANSHMVLIAR